MPIGCAWLVACHFVATHHLNKYIHLFDILFKMAANSASFHSEEAGHVHMYAAYF